MEHTTFSDHKTQRQGVIDGIFPISLGLAFISETHNGKKQSRERHRRRRPIVGVDGAARNECLM